jgi:exodeoxyribonuclease VII small subunit
MEDISKLSFEDAATKLDQIVRRLESGQVSLEESIAEYEKGVLLQRHCEKKLADAKLRVEKILGLNANGEAITEPFAES